MYNKVILLGNLTKEPELKYIPSGAAVLKCSIATSHKYKAQDGSQKEEVCFLEFSMFGKAAEVFNQYTHKGSKVMLEGRLALESWAAQDGTQKQKHSLKVEEFKFLDSKNDSGSSSDTNSEQKQGITKEPAYKVPEIKIDGDSKKFDYDDVNDDEIPF